MNETASFRASILLVDDDRPMRHSIRDYLETNGIRIVPYAGARNVGNNLSSLKPDLIVLNQQLRSANGLDVLRDIRRHSDVPLIVIVRETSEADRLVAFELGADDYLIEPFVLHELLARIRAILRRIPPRRLDNQRCDRYRFGGWTLDLRSRKLTSPEGILVALTRTEFAILVAFVKAARKPLSREQLMAATGRNVFIADRSINNRILRLRRKLEAPPYNAKVLKTVRGAGYCLVPKVEQL